MRQIGTLMLGFALVLQANTGAAQPAAPKPVVDAHGDPLPPGASLRLGSVAFRHRFEMPSLAYAPDGKTIAAPDRDRIDIWDIATEKVVRTLTLTSPAAGSSWWYHHVVYSPDGTLLLASAGIRKSDGDTSVAGRVFVWDALSGRFQRAINRTSVEDVCFCGDNKTIALAEPSQVTVWDATTGRKIGETQRLAEGSIRTMAFIPRLKQIVAGDERDTLHFWKLDGLDRVDSLTEKDQASAIGVSSDGRLVAKAGWSLTVRNAETRDKVASLEFSGNPDSVAFSPDGSLLAAGHRGGMIGVWETATWKRRHMLWNGRGSPTVRFSPDGKTLASSDSTDLVLRFWHVQTGKRVHRMAGHEGAVVSLAFSPGGARLASTASDQALRIWDPKTGEEVRVHEGPDVAGVAWSPDGTMIASGPWIYDAKNGEPLRSVTGLLSRGDRIRDVAFSPDGKFTAASSGEVRSLHATSGKVPNRGLPLLRVEETVVTPDGSRAVTWGLSNRIEVTLDVLDLVANRTVHSIRIPNSPFVLPTGRLALAADGKRFAFANASIHVFNLADPGSSRTFGESRHFVRSLAFAPHGKMLAVGRDDESVELWDIASERQIANFNVGQGYAASIAFSPDGRLIATGGADSTVLLWRLRDVLAGDGTTLDAAALWNDLGRDGDVVRAYRAIERLAARPDEAMPLFRKNVKPPTPIPAARLARLFADLDADDFSKREQATRDLAALGDVIEHDLVKLQKDAPSPEVARRAAGILERLGKRTPAEERAVLALEAIASDDAIRLLEELGRGAPGAALTVEAQAATERIARRRQAVN
jgi:WD40 repeat protein